MATASTLIPALALGGLARKLVADKLLAEEQAREFQQKAQRSGQ